MGLIILCSMMNRKTCVLLFNLIFAINLSAQQVKIDSLEQMLSRDIPDTIRLAVYFDLVQELRDINTGKGRLFGKKGIQLLEKIEDKEIYRRYGKKLVLSMGYLYEQMGDFDSAEYFFNHSLSYTKKTDTLHLIGIMGGLGNLKRHATQYDEALKYYAEHKLLITSCSYLKEERRNEFLSKNLSNTGDVYLFLGKYVESRLQYEEALDIIQTMGDTVRMARTISRIGLIHYYNEEYQKAIDKTLMVIRFDSILGNKNRMISNYNNIGLFYNNLDQPQKALEIHKRGLELANEIGSKRHIPTFLANIGLDYEKLNDPDTAVYLFSKSLSLAVENKNERQVSESVYYMANTISKNPKSSKFLYGFEKGKDPLSLIYNAIELAKEKNNLVFEKDSYQLLANVYKRQIYNKDKSESLADMEVKYETEKKEKQLALKDAELAQNELLISQQAIQRNSVIAGAIFLLIIAVVLYRNYRFKSKSNNEKESLLKEIHHRVKNNLQIIANLLYLQSNKFEDENIKNVLEEGQGRVRSMALIHQKLYENEDIKSIPFGEYVLELVNEIKVSFGEQAAHVNINVDAQEAFFDVDCAVPLGLIINELSTNAFKYAFEGRDEGQLSIYLTKSGNDYELHVSDNGKGLPEEIDIRKTRSLGLRLVRILSEQLEGQYSFNGDHGMSFKLRFAA